MLSLRLERLKGIKDNVSQIRSLRLDPSRAVQSAVKTVVYSSRGIIRTSCPLLAKLSRKEELAEKALSKKLNGLNQTKMTCLIIE